MKALKLLHLFLALSLISLMFVFSSSFADSETYPLPPLNSQTELINYPESVKEALTNVVGLRVVFAVRNSRNRLFEQRSIATGTGFMIYPGVFISAGHLITVNVNSLITRNFIFSFNKYGVPSSTILNYTVDGITDIGGQSRDFAMELVGLGDSNYFQDFMVLKAANYPTNLKPLVTDDRAIKIDEVIYNAGYVLNYMVINRQSNIPVLFDIIRKSFTGKVDAVITGLPINEVSGMKAVYRVEMKLEQGFSGGPIFDAYGRVIAITILRTNNYAYLIPISEVLTFVNKLKNDGVI